jgi:hypothetical protein
MEGLFAPQFQQFLAYSFAAMLQCWNAAMLECWNAGMLECWNASNQLVISFSGSLGLTPFSIPFVS